jgi:pimeloyl-ACP methyl ester carboxylesterase
VINLAGTIDMADNIQTWKPHSATLTSPGFWCTPADAPERYREASAINMFALGVPQALVWGAYDNFVPRPIVEKYVGVATQTGDSVRLVIIPGVGHFDTASPKTSAWSSVNAAIQWLLNGKSPQ